MKLIKINYDGTGIKLLRTVSNIILVLCLLAFAYTVIMDTIAGYFLLGLMAGLPYLISGLFLSALGWCVSYIAVNALYQKEYLIEKAKEEDIFFKETK